MKTLPLMKLPLGRRAIAILAFCGLWGGLASAPIAIAAPFIETVQGFALGSNQPDCTLVKDAFGRYYGTTYSGGGPGGFGGAGTIFRVSASGKISTLHLFNYSDGAGPILGLTAGADGNFYGVTLRGGMPTSAPLSGLSPTGVSRGFTPSAEKRAPNPRRACFWQATVIFTARHPKAVARGSERSSGSPLLAS